MGERPRHVVVVGGGITGLSAAFELRRAADPPAVTILEASDRLGGKILTTPFAGLPAVDAGPDSVLARVPWAVQLLRDLDADLADELVAPATGKASLWWHGELHPIPAGLVLGLPTGLPALARSRLLSWPGKARAAIEPLLPRTSGGDDLGLTVRRRFGGEVYDRLVGPLVGSINAADPRRISLAATAPQVAEAAARHRSLLLGLRHNRPTGATAAPVFLTHPRGLGHVVHRLAVALRDSGVSLRVGQPSGTIVFDGDRFRIGGLTADAVVLTVPADAAAAALDDVAPAAVAGMRAIRFASVAMVTLALPSRAIGRRLDGSGYLVPASEQRHVTACSWASSKWAHLERDGQVLLRASLGRDGDERALALDDDGLVTATLEDLRIHLGLRSDPTSVRVTRWPRSFPQYEPGHLDRVAAIEARLPAGILVAGSSYRGLGIASCIRQGREAARTTVARWVEPAKL